MDMSASEMVRLRMVTGNMMSIYQKKNGDASKKCREVKNIFQGSLSFRNLSDWMASDAIQWVETEKCGLKKPLKSRIRRF